MVVTIDVPKVRGKMAERGFDLTSLSAELGISRNTLAGYLRNPGKTPYSVISQMADVLCDNTVEATQIFFAPTLRNT